MKRNARWFVLLAALPLGGCVAAAIVAAAGATYATVKYAENEWGRDYHAGLGETWNAAMASLQNWGYPASATPTEGRESKEVSISPENMEGVWIRAEHMEGGFTRLRVRFGTFETEDHQRKSQLLFDDVAQRLGE